MKIHEIIIETKDEVTTWLALNNYSYVKMKNESEQIQKSYYTNPNNLSKAIANNLLLELNSKIYELANHPVWDQIEDDPEIDQIIAEFEELYQINIEFMRSKGKA